MRLSRAQNGRFFGYVLGSGEPGWCCGRFARQCAQPERDGLAFWTGGSRDRADGGGLAEAMRCPEFCGHLTGGGSSANLMGLAIAREVKSAANETGLACGGVVYASSEIHMSIPKSVALLGIGRSNLRLIATDESSRMIPEELDATIVADKAAGKTPLAVVALAGSVSTGAIDPLRQIAEVPHRHGAWFHIDGAYGALAVIAARQKFDGIELAIRYL